MYNIKTHLQLVSSDTIHEIINGNNFYIRLVIGPIGNDIKHHFVNDKI